MEYDKSMGELICRNEGTTKDGNGGLDYMSFDPCWAPASIDITCYNYDDVTKKCVAIAGISMSLSDFRILERAVNKFFIDNPPIDGEKTV